jgi:glycosyltransferase involved in cell wall biosynthesis
MLEGKRIGVVIPAHNEQLLLRDTLGGVPDFVDAIYVVDDASRDDTAAVAAEMAAGDPRIVLISHDRNRGVGGAVVTGYRRALADDVEVICVMNADNQMDPAELAGLAGPVARAEVEYAKANRLFTGQAWDVIPHTRYLGNAMLSLLTKIASGYWHVADSQAGYTAIAADTLKRLDLDRLYERYGYLNDILVQLNVWNARVRDVPSRPIYGIGERSGIRIRKVVPAISWLLFRRFLWRLWQKYVIRDFHPLVFFWAAGLFTSTIGFGLGVWQVVIRIEGYRVTAGTVSLVSTFLTFGLLFTLFAMWFDMESNKDLK